MTTELDLLSKNELRVEDIDLVDVDLRRLAANVAAELGFEEREVMVTDYSGRILTLDVLRRSVYPHQLLGMEAPVLARLEGMTGVHLGSDARVTANGVLGWIAADSEIDSEVLARASSAADRIAGVIATRACVISTGAEILDGTVRDTNRDLLEERLGSAGFSVDFRGPVQDQLWSIVAALNRTVEEGFGLIITTGGVGAEAKDLTVEAVLEVDRSAHTPYICTFEGAHQRHVKPGVRIAVARVNGTLIVSLPGPTDEVDASLDVLLPLLASSRGDDVIAEALAQRLREQWRQAHKHH